MQLAPCPRCGYAAPAERCPHCANGSRLPSLMAKPERASGGLAVGLAALPMGLYLLVRTPGIKRFLLPPLALTLLLFVGILRALWAFLDPLFDAIALRDASAFDQRAAWLRWLVEQLIAAKLLLWMAELGRWVFFLFASALVVIWAFSIVYEALSGPFLDEIHGRLEESWFGHDPRKTLERPRGITSKQCLQLSLWGGIPSALTFTIVSWQSGFAWNMGYLLALVPWLVVMGLRPAYGRWLWWICSIEGRALWVSVQAAALAGTVLVLFLWLKFVPWIGPPLFFALAGFAVALSLLDIPFSRRQWPLRLRLAFLRRHWPAVLAYGGIASALYLIPLLGQICMVPAASIGGLWLFCRLDKSELT